MGSVECRQVGATESRVAHGASAAACYHPLPPPRRRRRAIEALYASQHAAQRASYAAFYSSELGGIVTDPALMVVQIDDHMVHRGHAGAPPPPCLLVLPGAWRAAGVQLEHGWAGQRAALLSPRPTLLPPALFRPWWRPHVTCRCAAHAFA